MAWLVAFAVFSFWLPDTFPTWLNFQTIFASQTVLLILTLALVVGLSAGEFDLSVAAVLGFTQVMTAFLTSGHQWPIVPVVFLVLAAAVAVGGVNAFFIVKIGVPSIVMTLGMATLLLGISLGIAGPQQRIVGSTDFIDFVNIRWLFLPLAWYLALGLTLILYYVLEQTPLGRYIRFVGASHEVSRLAGIHVSSVRVLALLASSLIAAFAGLMQAGLQGSADIVGAPTFLLPAFAGAFLGATAFSPGRFNVWGAFVAVYFLVTGITGLQLIGLQSWVEQVFYGGSLIAAVAFAQLLAKGLPSPKALG